MHATPFRRAVDEGLVVPEKFYQIGLRGSAYEAGAYEWSKQAVGGEERVVGVRKRVVGVRKKRVVGVEKKEVW